MHSQEAEAPKDDTCELLIPLPCWGRGRELIPLNELPMIDFLKRLAAENPAQPISSLLDNCPVYGETPGGASQPSKTVPKRVLEHAQDARHSDRHLHTAEAQLKAAQVPLEKRPYDPSNYTHPYDLTPWAVSLSRVQPREPSSDSDDEDKDVLHRPLTFENDSMCETLSAISLESSTELEHESEGYTAEGIPDLERVDTFKGTSTGSLLETPADRLTPPRGTSQCLEPLPPQAVDSTEDSITGDQEAAKENDSDDDIPFYDLD